MFMAFHFNSRNVFIRSLTFWDFVAVGNKQGFEELGLKARTLVIGVQMKESKEPPQVQHTYKGAPWGQTFILGVRSIMAAHTT